MGAAIFYAFLSAGFVFVRALPANAKVDTGVGTAIDWACVVLFALLAIISAIRSIGSKITAAINGG